MLETFHKKYSSASDNDRNIWYKLINEIEIRD